MIAGPSEITIVCDKFSNPKWVASDLIAQAEHDVNSQCILISKDKSLIKNLNKNKGRWVYITRYNSPKKTPFLNNLDVGLRLPYNYNYN